MDSLGGSDVVRWLVDDCVVNCVFWLGFLDDKFVELWFEGVDFWVNVKYVLDWWFRSEYIVDNWDEGGFFVDWWFERIDFEYGWEDINCELFVKWWDDRKRMVDFWLNDGVFIDVCLDKIVKGGNVWLRMEVNCMGCVMLLLVWDEEENFGVEMVREVILIMDGWVLWLVLVGVMGGLWLEIFLEDLVVKVVLFEIWEYF